MNYKFLRAALCGVTLFGAAIAATPAAAVQRFVLTDLGALPDSLSSVARAISQNGAIGGESGLGAGGNNGTRFDGGPVLLPGLGGSTNTVIRGINNAGVAAATIQTTGGDDRAALLTTGGATQLGGLAGFAAAGALGINNNGVATGYALASGANVGVEGSLPVVTNATPQQAVVWAAGVATALSNGGGAIANSTGVAINDAGQVAGIARLPTNQTRAVSWASNGDLTILPLAAGFNSSRARAINANGDVAGQVTGTVDGVFNLFGAVWSSGALTVLPSFGAFSSTTRGINDAGIVVGWGADQLSENVNIVGQIWTLSGGTYTLTLLDSLVINLGGWQTYAPQAINDAGQIVGLGIDPTGVSRAYLLTPAVPEPASWAMLIAGFGLIGATARRRRAVAA